MINERVQIESTVSNCQLWHALASSCFIPSVHTVDGPAKSCIALDGENSINNGINHIDISTGAGFRWPIHRQELVIRQATGWCFAAGRRIFIESGLYIFCWLLV